MSHSSCDFVKHGNNYICEKCGFGLLDRPGVEWVGLCNPNRPPCKYRGQLTGRIHYLSGDYSSIEENEYACSHDETADTCVVTACADEVTAICRKCKYYEPIETIPDNVYNGGPGVPGTETPLQLGDYTERLFKSIGITQERYKEAKKLFGLSPICNCPARIEYLNKVSAWWRGES